MIYQPCYRALTRAVSALPEAVSHIGDDAAVAQLRSWSAAIMERLRGGGGKRSLRSRKRKYLPPEKPAVEDTREAGTATAAAAAGDGTSECVDTSLSAHLSFVDDEPEEVD